MEYNMALKVFAFLFSMTVNIFYVYPKTGNDDFHKTCIKIKCPRMVSMARFKMAKAADGKASLYALISAVAASYDSPGIAFSGYGGTASVTACACDVHKPARDMAAAGIRANT